MFRQHCGVARHAWNWGLQQCIEANNKRKGERLLNGVASTKFPAAMDLNKRLVREVKSHNPWYYESSSTTSNESLRHLDDAFKRMHKVHGSKFPKFKKKGDKNSFYTQDTNGPMGLCQNKIRIPKIGWVRTKESIPEGTQIKSVVISERAGRWFLSYKIEVPEETNQNTTVVGVDLGIKTFATLSTGEQFRIPKQEGIQKKLKRIQRQMCRRKKGSNRRNKTKEKLAKIHYRIANVRKDATHKLTHHLAKNHGVIVIENLNVKGMMKNHHLAAAIAASNFSEVRRQLEYKTKRFGSQLVVAGRFYPSSQICSGCGNRKKIKLSVRQYTCECGLNLDRDVNAAINLAASHAVTARLNPEVHASNCRCGNCNVKKPELLVMSEL